MNTVACGNSHSGGKQTSSHGLVNDRRVWFGDVIVSKTKQKHHIVNKTLTHLLYCLNKEWRDGSVKALHVCLRWCQTSTASDGLGSEWTLGTMPRSRLTLTCLWGWRRRPPPVSLCCVTSRLQSSPQKWSKCGCLTWTPCETNQTSQKSLSRDVKEFGSVWHSTNQCHPLPLLTGGTIFISMVTGPSA